MRLLGALFHWFKMQHLGRLFLTVLVTGAFLTGCQGTLGGVKGQHIQQPAQIALVKAGQQSGKFSDGYVTVKYRYTATDGSLQLAGTVVFESAIAENFDMVQTFDLGLLLADTQGKVLMQQGLTTAVENYASDPVDFNTTVFLPPQAVLMAFTYNGQAYGGGGQSPTTFWADPVER